MHTNDYALEIFVRSRLSDARDAAARRALVDAGRRGTETTLRTDVGAAIAALGRRLERFGMRLSAPVAVAAKVSRL
jgi:hypothetical protein